MATNEIRFSVDLVAASGHAEGHLSKLSKAERKRILARYKNFWRLAKAHPERKLAPAADIDEMWHVHLLFTIKYKNDSLKYFGYILEHNPDFGSRPEEHDEMDAIFNDTAELWKQRFDEAYSLSETSGFRKCYGFNRGIVPERNLPLKEIE